MNDLVFFSFVLVAKGNGVNCVLHAADTQTEGFAETIITFSPYNQRLITLAGNNTCDFSEASLTCV